MVCEEIDLDIINVNKLFGAIEQNIDESNIDALAQLLQCDTDQLREMSGSLNHVEIIKW